MPSDALAGRAALHETKRALRERVLAARDALPADVRAHGSAAIAAGIVALPAFAAARAVLLTLPFRSEWDTTLVARELAASLRRLVVPRVDRTARMLLLHEVRDLDRDVVAGWRGIPEPAATGEAVAPTAIDFVIVPGAAFDPGGGRLGYGGGYFDRLLPLMRPDATVVAGAFDEQVVERVPMAPYDARVPLLVTPTRTIVTGAR